jgi:hypothetical protein
MRTWNTGLSVVLAVMIGAAATWLWMSRPLHLAAHTSQRQGRPELPQVPRITRTEPDRRAADSGSRPQVTPASLTAPAGRATVVYDDSTYESMLTFAQSDANSGHTARDIVAERDRFALTPDDPEWARPTERALWDFFQASTGGPTVTSVACRSAGCEVQAVSQPLCYAACDGYDPAGQLRGDWPGDLPLRRQLMIWQLVGDRAGVIVTYSREEPADTSP